MGLSDWENLSCFASSVRFMQTGFLRHMNLPRMWEEIQVLNCKPRFPLPFSQVLCSRAQSALPFTSTAKILDTSPFSFGQSFRSQDHGPYLPSKSRMLALCNYIAPISA